MLGEGTYSKVYKARRANSDLILALKQIEICNFEGKELENILNEIRILSCIRHQNILEYIESFIDFESKTLCIVTEYADYGDLFECISWFSNSKKDINERDIWVIIFQILRGLKTLHNNKIIHRDLKSANIFLFSNGSVKIGDMNVSAIVSHTNNLATTQTGTPYYSSPEIWDETPYSYKSDMWSFGCLIYEMCSLKVPFDGENIYQLMTSISTGVFSPIPEKYSIEISTLINSLLTVDPEKRPSCQAVVGMGFVKDIEKYLKENSELGCEVGGEGVGRGDWEGLGKTLRFES